MIEIEPYRPEHLEGCAETFQDAFGQPPWGQSWPLENARCHIDGMVRMPGFQGWVAVEDGTVVGIALAHRSLRYDGAELMLEEFCVRAGAMGRGVGSALLERVKAEAVASGLLAVVLSTRADAPAAHFYEVRGFERVDRIIFMTWGPLAGDGQEAQGTAA